MVGKCVWFVWGGRFPSTVVAWAAIPNPANVCCGELEMFGPFDTEAEAVKVWKAKTMARVDICAHRMMVEAVPLDERVEWGERMVSFIG